MERSQDDNITFPHVQTVHMDITKTNGKIFDENQPREQARLEKVIQQLI